jgi:hypothetical protein
MALATFYASKDASVYEPNDGWSGWDAHHPVGLGSGKYRSFVYFPISFTGMTNINSATLYLRAHRAGSGNHVFGDGSVSRTLYVRRNIYDFGEGTNRGEGVWSGQEIWGWANRGTTPTTTGQGSLVFPSYADGTWYSIDVTDIVNAWKSGSPNYGVALINSNETSTAAGLEFYSRDAGTGYKPYLEIDYGPNTAPVAPTGLSPTGNALVNTLNPILTGTRSDPDAGDYITAYQIIVYRDDGTTEIWNQPFAVTGEPTTFSKVYAGPALSGGTFYKWKARTRDKGAAWGPYSALQRFKVNTPPNPPYLSIAETPTNDIKTLTPTLNITHDDNDATDVNMYGYHVGLETSSGVNVWDSGDVDTSGSPAPFKSFTYSGPALSWGTSYRFRARTKDQNGVWGPYAIRLIFTTHKTSNATGVDPTDNVVIPTGLVPVFTGIRGDDDDVISSYRLVLYASDQQTLLWDTGVITTGIKAGRTFTKVYDGSALSYDTQYYWKDNIVATIGGISGFSGFHGFKTPASASAMVVDTPTPNSLPTNATVTSLTPTFSGTQGSAFTNYQIQLYDVGATPTNLGTPIWDSGDLSQASDTDFSKLYDGPALAWATTYRWRVRTGNPTLGTWNGLAAFTTDSSGIPTLTSPANNEWVGDTTPTLTGTTNGGDLATQHQFRMYESNGTTLKWDSGWLSQSSSTTLSKTYDGPALAPGRTYLWQVRYAKSTGVVSPYSGKFSFRLNGSPTLPTQLLPVPGSATDSLTPTFQAFFNDPDKADMGDYPSEWNIEIRDSLTDTIIQTKTITSGLGSGLNQYVWDTGGGDTDLEFLVNYKWRTWFVDSLGAVGASSSYQTFVNAETGTVTITAPTDGSNINTTTPIVEWDFDGATQGKYRVSVIRVATASYVYTSSFRVGTNTSFQIPFGYLSKNGEEYTIQVDVFDTNALHSNIDEVTVQLTLDAPPAIEALSATVRDDISAIVLHWEASSLGSSFIAYVIYRRAVGDDEWTMIGTARPETNTTFTDYYAGQGVEYEYRVTVVKSLSTQPDLESPDSDIVQARFDGDVWMVIGQDRLPEHTFELFVVSESHTRPVQQEVFEPIGGTRKTSVRGFVLGWEGSLDVTWLPEEKRIAEAQIDYLLSNAGPHTLKNPFGDVYDVTFGTPDGSYQGAGVQNMTLTWIEVGNRTHNVLTPDEFLAQIGAE